MASAVLVAAATTAEPLVQIALGAVLGIGGLTGIAAFRKAPAEKELTTVQGMQILLGDTRSDRDDARHALEEAVAEKEAAEAHSLYLERRVADLQQQLRRWDHSVAPTPPDDEP